MEKTSYSGSMSHISHVCMYAYTAILCQIVAEVRIVVCIGNGRVLVLPLAALVHMNMKESTH